MFILAFIPLTLLRFSLFSCRRPYDRWYSKVCLYFMLYPGLKYNSVDLYIPFNNLFHLRITLLQRPPGALPMLALGLGPSFTIPPPRISITFTPLMSRSPPHP